MTRKASTSGIRERLEAAIRKAEESRLDRLRAAHERTARAERAFDPVRRAAEEIREHLQSVHSIGFTITPMSVCITLVDRELWFSYDEDSRKFIGEESAHSWYDGERYAQRYEWNSAEECIDAMIRLCAQYVRMAREIGSAATEK